MAKMHLNAILGVNIAPTVPHRSAGPTLRHSGGWSLVQRANRKAPPSASRTGAFERPSSGNRLLPSRPPRRSRALRNCLN
jgi:hypothetical protein